jgi:hypothetical protein
MDEDPSNEVFVLSLLEGYGANGAEDMDIEPDPAQRIGGPNTSPESIEESSSWIRLRLGASQGRPNRSP